MSSLLRNIVDDKQDIRNQLGTTPDTFSIPLNFNRQVSLVPRFSKQFVLDPADSFVLGSPTLGVLGTSKLGDRRVEVESFVYPFRNIVEEDLADLLFIDESVTTATIKIE